jgi:hypothetical protein
MQLTPEKLPFLQLLSRNIRNKKLAFLLAHQQEPRLEFCHRGKRRKAVAQDAIARQ